MLNLYTIKRVAEIIDVPSDKLLYVADHTDKYVRKKTLYDPTRLDRPNKRPRDVISVFGLWRRIQIRLYRRIFSPRIKVSPISYGGVSGRSIKTNALAHTGNTFLYVADISDFFPSISNDRIFRLFRKQLGCSPTVARLLTKLCTFDYHLALGLVTSPILSDEVLRPVDLRLMRLCEQSSIPALVPTRFVDDINISSHFNLDKTFVQRIVREILRSSGLKLKADKENCGRIADGMPITQIRVRGGCADVTKQYMAELERLIRDHRNLSDGGTFNGPLLTSSALEGKVLHACRVNPGRKRELWRHFRAIRWDSLWWNAKLLGLVPAEKMLVPYGAPAPDFSRAYSDGLRRPESTEMRSCVASDEQTPF